MPTIAGVGDGSAEAGAAAGGESDGMIRTLDQSERQNHGSDTKPYRTTNFRLSRYGGVFAETRNLTPPY